MHPRQSECYILIKVKSRRRTLPNTRHAVALFGYAWTASRSYVLPCVTLSGATLRMSIALEMCASHIAYRTNVGLLKTFRLARTWSKQPSIRYTGLHVAASSVYWQGVAWKVELCASECGLSTDRLVHRRPCRTWPSVRLPDLNISPTRPVARISCVMNSLRPPFAGAPLDVSRN